MVIVVVLKHSYIIEIWHYFVERHGSNQNYMFIRARLIVSASWWLQKCQITVHNGRPH